MERPTTHYDIEPGKFNAVLAKKLKEMPEFEMPEWAKFVKTSAGRERPPAEMGWWQARAASILRQVYLKGLIGVQKLKTRYGGVKDRGMAPDRFYKGSGKIIRVILQQAEKAGFIEKFKDKKAGRRLTKKGMLFLNEAAVEAKGMGAK